MITFDDSAHKRKLEKIRGEEQERLAQTLATRNSVEYIDLTTRPIDVDALGTISEKESREAKAAVFQRTGSDIHVAVLSTQNEKTQALIEKLKADGFNPTLHLASRQGLERAWERYADITKTEESDIGTLEVSSERIAGFREEVDTLEDVKQRIQSSFSEDRTHRTTAIFEIILAGALSLKASDIHLEPQEEKIRLRYRLDGVLNDIMTFDRETYSFLVSRVKLVSGLKLNVENEAQDGRFTIRVGEADIEIRSSIIPGEYGESVVLRVLDPAEISIPMEELGMEDRLFEVLKREIDKPNGMILTTGPTGSGKTTTLYAFMKKLLTPEVKIITIENPIEYHVEGIVQTQTDADSGYTFLSGLRSALRQDPDVIMVGEIRDEETASIAVNSALTGHLVFSTLHTNNAAGTFPRLIDLGVNPKVISSALNAAMAQRLVRKLCGQCSEEIALEGEEKELIERILGTFPERFNAADIPRETVRKPNGCAECNDTGYKGRIGIFEAIVMDENIESVLYENPNTRDIKAAAKKQELLDMRQDGILKVLRGSTSLAELKRSIDLYSGLDR